MFIFKWIICVIKFGKVIKIYRGVVLFEVCSFLRIKENWDFVEKEESGVIWVGNF